MSSRCSNLLHFCVDCTGKQGVINLRLSTRTITRLTSRRGCVCVPQDTHARNFFSTRLLCPKQNPTPLYRQNFLITFTKESAGILSYSMTSLLIVCRNSNPIQLVRTLPCCFRSWNNHRFWTCDYDEQQDCAYDWISIRACTA